MLFISPHTVRTHVKNAFRRLGIHSRTEAAELDGRLTWAGFRRDIADICFASDAVVLTSDNEGTPVSLIEALAAGTPVVATRVGGVASVVPDGPAASLPTRMTSAGSPRPWRGYSTMPR